MLLLTGDLGGTNARVALARISGTRVAIEEIRIYPSAAHESVASVLETYRADVPASGGALAVGLGVAGPVHRQTCRVTNLPWHVDAAALKAECGVPVRLVNDFEAVGFALPALDPADRVMLQPGEPDPEAPMALLGAGTGLGEALVLPGGPSGGPAQVVPGEGGHADFAPQSALEAELLAFLRARHGHVSWERVLSGAGLVALFDFLAARSPADVAPQTRAAMDAPGADRAAVVTTRAGEGDPVCDAAVELFLGLYGAEAGNHALRSVARGGVYLAGGIGPRLLERLREPRGSFLRNFRAKGRFDALLETLPVFVLVDPWIALRGAALAARALVRA